MQAGSGNKAWTKGKAGTGAGSKKKAATKKPLKTNRKATKSVGKVVDKSITGVSFSRLRSMTIDTGWLTKVAIVGEGILELENSWTEFILTLLGLLYEVNQDKFMKKLSECGILNSSIKISTKLVNYPETSGIKNEIYKLGDSPFFVEFRRNGEDYLHSIRGMLIALNIDLKSISFDIEPLKLEVNGINTSYENVKQKEVKATLESLMANHIYNINVTAITVFGYKQKTKSTTQALILFMIWAQDSYGKTLEDAGVKCSLDGVGMTTAAHIDEYSTGFHTMKLGEKYLYTCDDNTSILKYLESVVLHIRLSPNIVELEYKILELV